MSSPKSCLKQFSKRRIALVTRLCSGSGLPNVLKYIHFRFQQSQFTSAPHDRGQWLSTCRSAIAAFEEARVASLQRKRAARKHQVVSSTNTAWPCDRCDKVCSSRIGLFANRLPIDEAVCHTRRCSPCMCVNSKFCTSCTYLG